MKLIDLTQTYSIHTPCWPGFPSNEVTVYQSHARDRVNSLIVRTNMHTATHVDAPQHFSPRGWFLHEVPLERLYGTGVVVDLTSQVRDLTIITRPMLERALPEPLRENDILIVYTGWKRFNWEGETPDEDRYFCYHPGPDMSVVDWLIEKNVKWVGTDAPSFEHPLLTGIRDKRPDVVARFEAEHGAPVEELLPRRLMLESHRRMMTRNLMHVDALGGDVDQVVGRRVTVGAFPWRFDRGEASICRVVVFAGDDD